MEAYGLNSAAFVFLFVGDYSELFAVNFGVKTLQFIPSRGCNHEGLYFCILANKVSVC